MHFLDVLCVARPSTTNKAKPTTPNITLRMRPDLLPVSVAKLPFLIASFCNAHSIDVGCPDGTDDGLPVGMEDTLGVPVGSTDGDTVGDGDALGSAVGWFEGAADGVDVGLIDGVALGRLVGSLDGVADGCREG